MPSVVGNLWFRIDTRGFYFWLSNNMKYNHCFCYVGHFKGLQESKIMKMSYFIVGYDQLCKIT